MREWNQQCEPKEKYSHVSNFRRDAPPRLGSGSCTAAP